MTRRAFSLRDVPPIMYVAIGLSLVTTIAYVAAIVSKGIHEFDADSFRALAVWSTADQTAASAYGVLVPLGMLALARRQTGPHRALTIVGAALGFSGLAYLVVNLVFVVSPPRSDVRDLYDLVGYFVGLTQLAGAVLLTIGARAWTRVPVAAVFLFVLIATSHWVPGVSTWISDQLGRDQVVRSAYNLARECGWAACYIFIAAAIAAQVHRAPEPQRAASGFRIARGALLARLLIALGLVFALLIGGTSRPTGQLFTIGTPLVAMITMMIFAIAVARVSTSDVDGLPRFRLALAAGAIMWWTFLQLYVASAAYVATTDRSSGAIDQGISALVVAGALVVALAFGLIGSGVSAFAMSRGDQATASQVTGRTIAMVGLALGSIAVQTAEGYAHSPSTAIAMMVAAIGAGLAALLMLIGILARAAAIVSHTHLPRARVV